MLSLAPATVGAVLSLLGLVSCLSPAPVAAQQQPARADVPVSLERIRQAVERPSGESLELDVSLSRSLPTFKTTVEQRTYMLSFEEQLRKDLEPTLLQRQSRDWASKCCGLDLDLLFKPIDRALQRRKERKIRQKIARELEELQAARHR